MQPECKNAASITIYIPCQRGLALLIQIRVGHLKKVTRLLCEEKLFFLFFSAMKIRFLEEKQGLQPVAAAFKGHQVLEFLVFVQRKCIGAFV